MYELVQGHLHPLLSQSVSTNCVLERMQGCMKNRRTGCRITLNNYSHCGKTRTKAYVSINALPKLLSVAQGGYTAYPQSCPSVLRAACLILQPGLVKFRSRHPRQQVSSHPPPRSDWAFLVLSRMLCMQPHQAFCEGVLGENILLYSLM